MSSSKSHDQSKAARSVACRSWRPPCRSQQPEALVHARQHGRRRHHAHPRSGQFDGQRQTIEKLDKLRDGRSVRGCGCKPAPGGSGAVDEQQGRFVHIHRCQRHGLFAGQTEHFARGHQETSVRSAVEPAAQGLLGMASHLLEVVQDDQAPAAAGDGMAELLDRVVGPQWHAQALGHGLHDAFQTPCRRQVAEPCAAGEVAEPGPTEAYGQARLAGASDAKQ